MRTDYEQQAQDFLDATGTTLTVEYIKTAKYFHGDKEARDIFRFTLTNERGSYSSTFGDSILATANRMDKTHDMPSAYTILACLEKYEPDPDFFSWCRGFGYDDSPVTDYPRIKAIHDACIEQFTGLSAIFTDLEMENLQEIQ